MSDAHFTANRNLMIRAIELAASAREKGNHPFGALLADTQGNIVLEAENTAFTDHDFTRHAETNLLSAASRKFSLEELETMVMYASCEPCAMCAGASFFTGVRNIVYGLSADALADLWIDEGNDRPIVLDMSCREVFATSLNHPTNVIGPYLEGEAKVPHVGYKNPQA